MTQRVITAAIALAVLLPVLFLGGVAGAQVICLVAACLALWELGELSTPRLSPGTRVFSMVLASLPILAAGIPTWFAPGPGDPLARAVDAVRGGAGLDVSVTRADWVLLAAGVAFLAVPIRTVLVPRDITTAPARMASTLYGVVYLGLTLGLTVMLRAQPNGLLWICFTLAVVFLGDTGAYVVGRMMGKHKLHPKVSPGKTWEGAVAGLVTAVVSGFLAKAVFDGFGLWEGPSIGTVHVIAAALLAGATGQVGDLAESLLKRAVGVKDSGTMFPGHGGMLDRIDALLFALPTVYFYVKFVFPDSL